MKSEVKMGKQVEIERKYIIKMPDPKMISSESGYTESRILQIYLESEPGETHRIRRRERSGAFVYTETIKKRIDKISSFEDEREISEEEFIRLSKKMKSGTRPIIKTRYTFDRGGQTFEIDVYPDWERTAIMETELDSREKAVEIPSFLEIVREVSGDFRYSNASMSREFPKEDEAIIS